MIEMLTPLAIAACVNCDQDITLYRSDMRLEPFWSHTDSGVAYCAQAPLAQPALGSVRRWRQTD
jgi:hypothetical protein